MNDTTNDCFVCVNELWKTLMAAGNCKPLRFNSQRGNKTLQQGRPYVLIYRRRKRTRPVIYLYKLVNCQNVATPLARAVISIQFPYCNYFASLFYLPLPPATSYRPSLSPPFFLRLCLRGLPKCERIYSTPFSLSHTTLYTHTCFYCRPSTENFTSKKKFWD